MINVRAAVDPQIVALLHSISKKMMELNHPPLDLLTPEQSRYYYQIAREFFTTVQMDGVTIENTYIKATLKHEIPIRIYTPDGEGPFPILVYFHGGGWVFGDLDSSDHVCRYFSKEAGIVVVSVAYRLAPEHKYPAAFLDAIDSVRWAFQHVKKLNGDSTRILVGGESSGGNLAAATAIYYREDEEFKLSHQFLITPVLDYNFDTLSYRANYQFNLTTEKMKWFWGQYLKDPTQGREIFASPLQVSFTKGLPETLLVTADFDPLREEGLSFVDRLREDEVKVEHLHFENMVHSFINMIGTSDEARKALIEITKKLREMLYIE